jgi:hypothetical protein
VECRHLHAVGRWCPHEIDHGEEAIVCQALQSGTMKEILGFKLDADGGERLRFSGAEFIVKASAASTGGSFTALSAGGDARGP